MVYFERMAYIEEKFYQIWKDMSLNDSTDEYERSKLAVWDYPVRYYFKPRPIGFPSCVLAHWHTGARQCDYNFNPLKLFQPIKNAEE